MEPHKKREGRKFKKDYLRAAHKASSRNFGQITIKSDSCCCFYCGEIFEPAEIKKWTPEKNPSDKTALCPRCGIDSVIGSESGYPVTDGGFIKEMRKFWFPG